MLAELKTIVENDLGLVGLRARLDRAIADTPDEVLVLAEAVYVGHGAAELGRLA